MLQDLLVIGFGDYLIDMYIPVIRFDDGLKNLAGEASLYHHLISEIINRVVEKAS